MQIFSKGINFYTPPPMKKQEKSLFYIYKGINNCNSSFFSIKLAGYALWSDFSNNLKFYASTFIGIVKLFKIFLKTRPYKLFKNYEYIYRVFCYQTDKR